MADSGTGLSSASDRSSLRPLRRMNTERRPSRACKLDADTQVTGRVQEVVWRAMREAEQRVADGGQGGGFAGLVGADDDVQVGRVGERDLLVRQMAVAGEKQAAQPHGTS